MYETPSQDKNTNFTIILATDGEPTSPSDDVMATVRSCMKEHPELSIVTYGMGPKAAVPLLSNIAKEANGDFLFMPTANDIPAYMISSVANMESVLMNATLKLQLGKGVTLAQNQAFGFRPLSGDTIALGPLVAGHTLHIPLTLEYIPGKIPMTQALLTAKLHRLCGGTCKKDVVASCTQATLRVSPERAFILARNIYLSAVYAAIQAPENATSLLGHLEGYLRGHSAEDWRIPLLLRAIYTSDKINNKGDGRITKGLLERRDKWGLPYAWSDWFALYNMRALNNDPNQLIYGSYLVYAIKAHARHIFTGMNYHAPVVGGGGTTLPSASSKPKPVSAYVAPVTTSAYSTVTATSSSQPSSTAPTTTSSSSSTSTAQGGCIAENAIVVILDPKTQDQQNVEASAVRCGDWIDTGDSTWARVVHVVHIHGTHRVAKLQGHALTTLTHPIMVPHQKVAKCQDIFKDQKNYEEIECKRVCNFVLAHTHVIRLPKAGENVRAVTWGHNADPGCAMYHPFYGSRARIRGALKAIQPDKDYIQHVYGTHRDVEGHATGFF
jgi:hypothetical protein